MLFTLYDLDCIDAISFPGQILNTRTAQPVHDSVLMSARICCLLGFAVAPYLLHFLLQSLSGIVYSIEKAWSACSMKNSVFCTIAQGPCVGYSGYRLVKLLSSTTKQCTLNWSQPCAVRTLVICNKLSDHRRDSFFPHLSWAGLVQYFANVWWCKGVYPRLLYAALEAPGSVSPRTSNAAASPKGRTMRRVWVLLLGIGNRAVPGAREDSEHLAGGAGSGGCHSRASSDWGKSGVPGKVSCLFGCFLFIQYTCPAIDWLNQDDALAADEVFDIADYEPEVACPLAWRRLRPAPGIKPANPRGGNQGSNNPGWRGWRRPSSSLRLYSRTGCQSWNYCASDNKY